MPCMWSTLCSFQFPNGFSRSTIEEYSTVIFNIFQFPNGFSLNVVEDSVITMPNNKRFTVPIGLNTIDWLYAGGNNLRSARLFAPSLEKRRKIARIIPHLSIP